MIDSIEGVAFLPAVHMPGVGPVLEPGLGQDDLVATEIGGAVGGANFGQMFSEGVASMNQKLAEADRSLMGLASGAETNLHQVMMKLEDAKLSLQLMLQVRSRLLEAYSELTRMQI